MYPNQVYSWNFIWAYILQCSESRAWLFKRALLSKKEAQGIISNDKFFYEFDSCVSVSKHHEKHVFKDSMLLSVYKKELGTILGFGFRNKNSLLTLIKDLHPDRFDSDSIKSYLEAGNFQSRIVKKYLCQNGVSYLIGMEFTWLPDGSLLVTSFSRPSAPSSRNVLASETFDKTQCVDVRHCESRLFSMADADFLMNASNGIDDILNPNVCDESAIHNGIGSLFDPKDTDIKYTGFSNGLIVPIHSDNFENKYSEVDSLEGNYSKLIGGYNTKLRSEDSSTMTESTVSSCFENVWSSTLELDIPYISSVSQRKQDTFSLKIAIEKSPSHTGSRLQVKMARMLPCRVSKLFYSEEGDDNADILLLARREILNPQEKVCGMALENEYTSNTSNYFDVNTSPNSFNNMYNRHSEDNYKIDCTPQFEPTEIGGTVSYTVSESRSKFNSIGWKCMQCEKIIKGKRSNLNRHVEYVHNKKYDFQCQEKNCSSRFQSLANLKRHILAVHREKKFNCRHCTRKFKSDRLMRTHIEIAHIVQKDRFRCADCGGCYSRKMVLQRHLKMSHD